MLIDSVITADVSELERREWAKLFDKLTFTVDEVEYAAYTHDDSEACVKIPRGAWNHMPGKLRYADLRSKPRGATFSFHAKLDADNFSGQKTAIARMREFEQGVIVMPPGRGKTNVGLYFAATCGTPTLVVVHTKELFDQWIERACQLVPDAKIGRIDGTRNEEGDITIAMAQTLVRYIRSGGKFWRRFGCLLIDEAHHAAATSWEYIANSCPAYYRFGLTATDKRADKLDPLINWVIGPVIFRLPFKAQIPMFVQPVYTDFHVPYSAAQYYNQFLKRLTKDEGRNALIARYANQESANTDNRVLVLSRRIGHLRALHDAMGNPSNALVLTGALTGKLRKRVVDGFRDGTINCLLATQLADEGLDVPEINRLLLTFPGKAEGKIVQQVGRASRSHADKADAIVYDFVDWHVSKAADQYEQRRAAYKTIQGLTIRKAVRDYGTQGGLSLLDRLKARRGAGGN